MKLLIIEDQADLAEEITSALHALDLPVPINVTVARSKSSALEAIRDQTYDFVVCDRRIPSTDGALDAADEHGDSVFDTIRLRLPGTPTAVLTAFASLSRAQELIKAARSGDVFGSGEEWSMAILFTKDELLECLEYLKKAATEIAILEDIEIDAQEFEPGRELTRTERRLIQVFARPFGSIVRVRPLGGGLSDARTCLVIVEDRHGTVRGRTVAKLGQLDAIRSEEHRFLEHVASSLNVPSFTALWKKIEVGAGDVAGLFYSLANGYDKSLFDLVVVDPDAAAAVVTRLDDIFKPWTQEPPRRMMSVGDIRRLLIDDNAVSRHCVRYLDGIPWEAFERRRVNVNLCPQHGDLHGHNVLVTDDGRPVLIDYGDVCEATSVLDPVTLELSLIFHPKNIRAYEEWPSLEEAQKWPNVDEFAGRSRFAPVINAARALAVKTGVGQRELYATAYAYAMRQLKYIDTDKEVAVAIISSAINAFG
jgi:CheY-like chemotaxis protein